MGVTDPLAHFPLKITVEAEDISRDYVREPDCFAIHGPLPPALNTAVLYSFDDPIINVCRGEISAAAPLPSGLIVTPVYRLGSNGPQGVPTGRVLIRFQSGVPVEGRRQELKACGFSILETLSYAPHAAWLQALDGNIAAALNGFEELRALRDVALVDPQMLMRRMER
jgi:hypothetical protein